MNWKKTIDYIQDKPININDNWYYHSMIKEDLELVKEILQNGLKSAHLRGEKRGGLYNGKYYISLNKRNEDPDSSFNQYAKHHDIRFIFDNINPIHAKFNFDIFFMFCNTIIPIRSSGWEDEYHAFGKVEPSKIVALEYSLHYMTKEGYRFDKEKLIYLKQVILCLKELKKDLPIYDYTSNKEYNKDKVLSLNL